MANSAGISNTFKQEILSATHNLNSHSLKMALYQTSASIGPTTTAYTATGEVSSANYTGGGAAVTNGTATLTSGVGHWTPAANITWSNVSFTTDCALLYNTSASNKTIAAYTFAAQTVSSGDFTLTMPTDNNSTALVRIS